MRVLIGPILIQLLGDIAEPRSQRLSLRLQLRARCCAARIVAQFAPRVEKARHLRAQPIVRGLVKDGLDLLDPIRKDLGFLLRRNLGPQLLVDIRIPLPSDLLHHHASAKHEPAAGRPVEPGTREWCRLNQLRFLTRVPIGIRVGDVLVGDVQGRLLRLQCPQQGGKTHE